MYKPTCQYKVKQFHACILHMYPVVTLDTGQGHAQTEPLAVSHGSGREGKGRGRFCYSKKDQSNDREDNTNPHCDR